LFGIYLRARARLGGDTRYALYRQLLREQWLPAEEIKRLQATRLRTLIAHTLVKSPFYSKRDSDLLPLVSKGFSLDDLANFPLLTRSDLQNHFTEILCPDCAPLWPDSSGGSTGHPVNFWHDSRSRTFADACELLFLSWVNVAVGDRTAVFWGADRDFHEMSLKERLMRRVKRVKLLNSFDMSADRLDDFLRQVEAFRPKSVTGYSSSLHYAARHINATKKYSIRPKVIRSSAEMLYDFQRQEIERAFGAPVFNFYGSREVSHLAAECSAHNGLHVFASGRIVEVVAEDGSRLPPGETGYLAVTDLSSYAFPFIRYLNGDMGAISSEKCPCGRGYPLLSSIAGRSSDIICVNGRHIHGEYFTHLFYHQPQVRQFQVVQEAADKLVIRIVASGESFDERCVLEPVRELVGENIALDIELVDAISPTESGKYRFTINRMA